MPSVFSLSHNEEIQGQLKLYEDDNAEALLNQLLSKLEKETGSR